MHDTENQTSGEVPAVEEVAEQSTDDAPAEDDTGEGDNEE